MNEKAIPRARPKGSNERLSAEEKKQLVALKKKDGGKRQALSAQRSIPYIEMYRDGICRVNSRLYTKSIRYEDINYQLAQNDEKTAIFENWCDFLNYFDHSVSVQLSFINQKVDLAEFQKIIVIPPKNDDFDEIRTEYSDMLQEQLTKGNNGLVKRKYITFGIEADSIKLAKPKLERIELDIKSNFKRLGVQSFPLSGYERLKVLHDIFNMDTNEAFRFSEKCGVLSKRTSNQSSTIAKSDWQQNQLFFDMIARTGLSSKDFIAPTSFDFREAKTFRMGNTYGAVSFVQILAPELSDELLTSILNIDDNISVNLHIRTVDQARAIKEVKSKITDLDAMKIQEQKKAVRNGYDMEILPSDLTTFGTGTKKILQDLQTLNERMFLVTVLIMHTAQTRQKLKSAVYQTESLLQQHNCSLKRLDFQQEAGLMAPPHNPPS